jgi:hypothetical protein
MSEKGTEIKKEPCKILTGEQSEFLYMENSIEVKGWLNELKKDIGNIIVFRKAELTGLVANSQDELDSHKSELSEFENLLP